MSESSEKANENKGGRRAPIVVAVLIALTGAAVAFRDKLDLPEFWKPAAKGTASADAVPAGAQRDARADVPLLPELQPAPPSTGAPGFDVARIAPDGVSVFAGHAAPNSNVTVLADGKPVGTVKADGNGEWILSTEYKFGSADPMLALEAAPDGTRVAALESAPAPAKTEAPAVPVVSAKAAPKAPVVETPRAGTQKSAEQVTTGMIQNLERLVEEARKAEKSAQGAPVAAKPAAEAAAQPAEAVAAPKVAAGEAPSPPVAANRASNASPAPTAIPVPITFEYRRPEFTHDGKRAVSLLAEYVKLKGYASIALSGHADERGSEAENVALSRLRLDAVAQQLREGGFSGQLDLQAKGEGEPYTGIDRSQYTRDALFQLDRRVELRLVR